MEITGVTYSSTHYEHYNQNGDRNYFEEVIDAMILDGISGMNDSFRNAIMSLDRDKKRMTILSLLDKDLNLFKRIKALTDKNIGKMDHIKDIILMLREYVKVGEVEKKKFGEVMTPLELVKEMLATLPEEVWSNPNLKWLDPANGTGPYPIMVIYKLMNGLTEWEPDAEKRYKHIVENMIYVCELQPKNMFLYMCAIDPFDAYKLNIYTGSFLEEGFDFHMKNVWRLDKFDICLGNPPYQEMDGGAKASAKPIYNLFTEKSIKFCEKSIFVTPSRWFAGGKGLDNFRKMMMESNKIRLINHFSDASKIFGKSVDITGGVSYFLYDKSYNGDCLLNGSIIDMNKYDIVLEPKNYSIVDKVSEIESISSICMGRGDNTFGIQTNDIRVKSERLDNNHIKCFVSKNKGFEKWININDVKSHTNLHTYKVITAESNGEYPRFGNKFIGSTNEVCSGSYIWFSVNNLTEAESLISYLNCKIPNYLLSLRKISQHIKPDTCKWIPLLPLDRIWTDKLISDYLNLSDAEQNLIIG
jgi:hypothetical protein